MSIRKLVLVVTLVAVSSTGALALDFGWLKGGKKTSQKAENYYIDATRAYGSADYSKTIALATKAIAEDKNFAKAFLLRGKATKDTGDIDRALKDLDLALTLNPKLGEAYFIRAQSNEIMGEMDKANADYKKGCDAGYKMACN